MTKYVILLTFTGLAACAQIAPHAWKCLLRLTLRTMKVSNALKNQPSSSAGSVGQMCLQISHRRATLGKTPFCKTSRHHTAWTPWRGPQSSRSTSKWHSLVSSRFCSWAWLHEQHLYFGGQELKRHRKHQADESEKNEQQQKQIMTITKRYFTWMDKLMSIPRPWRMILIRSAKLLRAPCAQLEIRRHMTTKSRITWKKRYSCVGLGIKTEKNAHSKRISV